jgi:hypothetical protein
MSLNDVVSIEILMDSEDYPGTKKLKKAPISTPNSQKIIQLFPPAQYRTPKHPSRTKADQTIKNNSKMPVIKKKFRGNSNDKNFLQRKTQFELDFMNKAGMIDG